MVKGTLALAAFVPIVAASPRSKRTMHVHERHENVPSGYMKDGAVPSDYVLNLRLALVQSNLKSLEDKLYAVSTPGNAEYGQHLSKEQALVAPSSDTTSAVKDWLSSHGKSSNTILPAGDWVGINVTVKQANTLLDADYSTFTHQSTGEQTGVTHAGLFNKTGRAFSDLAAFATNVKIVLGGQFGAVDGTSCSTPITASLFALLNDELIAAGKAPLGFLNPLIYANKGAFTDITSGDNPGCGTNGFSAGTGWDPVTGVGSPIYSKLRIVAGL
ncbi:hypothetical protein EWM64_g6214 [Hericium alpestre]|uniref:Peptidase S53 domain-containing protein n=1 Tax=Hericium alpestre TaxID=135208 RepID=A0A4Y9ZTA0_9AGAM|nr:hypothetical protein EWM64_g6214 [Hericium alpestre]